jgi:hypothetical protein
LFIEVDDPSTAADSLNDDLDNLNQWAIDWKVTFSPPKTKDMVISRKREGGYPPSPIYGWSVDKQSRPT